jgi:type III secretory pathway lipoprotein EscJ
MLLAVVACLTSACGEKSVARVASENEAIEILDRLREYRIGANKEEVGEGEAAQWSINVDEGWFGGDEGARATQVLRYYGLPRPDELKLAKEDAGVFPSPSIENAQRLREREIEMERKLRLLPGVARANVTIVLPEDDTIKLDPYPATASVLLVHKEPEPAFKGEQVQHQVAGGVPSLKPEKVTVSMLYETPPPLPPQENVRRRNSLLLAAGIGLLTVFCFLLVILLLQTRRQRAEIVALREGEEGLGLQESTDDAHATLDAGAPASLRDTTTASRQLPDGGLSANRASAITEDPASVK